MKYKTTKKDFELFSKYCDDWAEKLSIDDFEINIWHEDPLNPKADCEINIDYKYRRVDIYFSINNFHEAPKKEYIEETAKHEILHLLVGEMKDLAQDRYVIQDEIIKADERLIRKLEKII